MTVPEAQPEDGLTAGMIAARFTGSIAPYAAGLRVVESGSERFGGGELLGSGLGRLIDLYAATYPGADRRAVASMWSQWSLGAVLVPLLLARLIARRSLPVALEDLTLVPHADGRIAGLAVPAATRFRPEPPDGFVQDLLAGHVDPLGRALSDQAGLGRRVVAVNAAILTDWVLGQCAGREDVDPREIARLRELLFGERRPDGAANPFHTALTTAADGAIRRRVCCLRYLLPGMADCGDLCPLLTRSAA